MIQTDQELFKNIMRQPSESNSQPQSHHSENSKKNSHKRIIKKEKNLPSSQERLPSNLNKQQRALIQKEKNREAAQRSRDQHREYVLGLEKEVADLRQQVERNQKYCQRCRGELEQATRREGFFDINQEGSLTNSAPLPVPQNFDEEEEQSQLMGEEQSLVRLIEPQEDNSIWKMVLFMAMIALGVIVLNSSGSAEIYNKRTLLQAYSVPGTTPVVEDHVSSENIEEKYEDTANGLVRTSGGIDNEMCLQSLMKVELPIIRRSLRSVHDRQMYSTEGILVCSFKTPKTYTVTPQLSDSPLVRLFILGSQIKEMLTPGLRSLTDSNIQLNGIYQIDAQVKKVDLVPQHNCLL